MDSSLSWIAVAMAAIAMVGTAVERTINWLNNREKVKGDTTLAIKQAEIVANTQALEDRVNRQALQLKASDSSHSLTQKELSEVKSQNANQQKQLDDCKAVHDTVRQQLDDCKQAHVKTDTLEKRVADLETTVSVIAPSPKQSS